MKKITGIIIAALVVAGIVLLLAGNRKEMERQTSSVAADGREVVMTCVAGSESLNRSFSSNGVVKANNELNFVSETSGRVVAVYADMGSRVAKGAPLLKVDTQLLEADYKASLASYEALKKDEERFTRSNEAGGVSNQQLDNIRTQLVAAESRLEVSRWKLDNATVKSPISGTVNMRYVEPGALIAPNVPLFEIVDASRMKVICNVSGSKAALLKAGDEVTATSSDAPGKVFHGTVRSVGVKTDRGLNYPVEVVFGNDDSLRTGMYLKVDFAVHQQGEGVFVPRRAVVGSVLAANVYVVEDGKACRREVRLGDMYGDNIEILEGLAAGEEIVIAGLMNIADGTPVKVVNRN